MVVWHLPGMPRWLRQAFVLPVRVTASSVVLKYQAHSLIVRGCVELQAFISSIAWFDVGADELVRRLIHPFPACSYDHSLSRILAPRFGC